MSEVVLNKVDEIEDSEDQHADDLTAGAVLKAERCSRDLSEKEVADKLHITMHYVRAIESDCYNKLPGAVFAKGYIKSYANLLGLNEAEVVQLYMDMSRRREENNEEKVRRKARKRKDRNRPWLILSAVIFIGGFTALWLYNKYSVDEAPEQSAALPITQEAGVTNGQTDSIVAAVPEIISADAAETITVQSDSNAALLSSVENMPDAISTVQEVAAEEPDSQLAAKIPEQQVIAVDAAGNDMLRVSFSGESWIEISDADSIQIYRDIREAGDILEISGNAPFNILLGDAPFTSMTLNGESINVVDNIRIDNSARLTVGL